MTHEESPEIEVIAIDHIYLTVSDLARSEAFYDTVFRLLDFRKGDRRFHRECHEGKREFRENLQEWAGVGCSRLARWTAR